MTARAVTKAPVRRRRGVLWAVVIVLSASGVVRLGTSVAEALAQDSGGAQVADARPAAEPAALLAALQEREARVTALEAAVAERMQALAVAEARIGDRMAALVAAESALAAMLTLADEAAEADVLRLIAVYESMKPKEAAVLFQEMEPDFAAGFLARMRPEAAAGIMAGLPPRNAYAISVTLAGRNALAPTE